MIADDVRALVASHAEVPPGDDEALALDSLTLISVIEAVEEKFGVRVGPRDAIPANFGSISRIALFVESRRVRP